MRLGAAGRAPAPRRSAAGSPAAAPHPTRRPPAVEANSASRSRLTWTWVAFRSLIAQQPRAPGEERRVRREVAPVEEVPGDGGELHGLSIRSLKRDFLTGEELGAFELGRLLDRALELKAGRRGRGSAPRRSPGAASPSSSRSPSTRTRISFEVGRRRAGRRRRSSCAAMNCRSPAASRSATRRGCCRATSTRS